MVKWNATRVNKVWKWKKRLLNILKSYPLIMQSSFIGFNSKELWHANYLCYLNLITGILSIILVRKISKSMQSSLKAFQGVCYSNRNWKGKGHHLWTSLFTLTEYFISVSYFCLAFIFAKLYNREYGKKKTYWQLLFEANIKHITGKPRRQKGT